MKLQFLAISAFLAVSCGSNNSSEVKGIGTSIPPAERPLEVYDSHGNYRLDRQLKLLSKAHGLTEVVSLRWYRAVDMDMKGVSFLAPAVLEPGDIVKAGSVFVVKETGFPFDRTTLMYREIDPVHPDITRLGVSGAYFSQLSKDGVPLGVGGVVGAEIDADGVITTPGESLLVGLCDDKYWDSPSGKGEEKNNCDLNIEDGKLKITYGMSEENIQGTSVVFNQPVKFLSPTQILMTG